MSNSCGTTRSTAIWRRPSSSRRGRRSGRPHETSTDRDRRPLAPSRGIEVFTVVAQARGTGVEADPGPADTAGFQGKVAVVTGGGCGIGEACVRLLASEGLRSWSRTVDIDAARQVAKDIGDTALAIEVDVADPRACELMVDAAVDHVRLAGRRRQQRRDRWPAGADGRLPPRRLGTRHRRQPRRGVQRHPRGDPGDAGRRRGRDRQHGVRARVGGGRGVGGLRRGEARCRRADEDSRP